MFACVCVCVCVSAGAPKEEKPLEKPLDEGDVDEVFTGANFTGTFAAIFFAFSAVFFAPNGPEVTVAAVRKETVAAGGVACEPSFLLSSVASSLAVSE